MKTIIIREIMDHLKSIQFMLLVCLSIGLFISNGIIFRKNYTPGGTAFDQKPSTVSTTLSVPKSSLLFISEGGDKYRPSSYILQAKGSISPNPSTLYNFKLPDVPVLDWAFIIKVIFSLYVLLLGYDAVSGEKEQGTLRLILSNSMSRISIVIAKYLTILITIFIPLLIGVLTSLIIIGFSAPQVITLSTILRVILILLLSFMYISLFTFLSLLLSSIIHDSSLVLLVLLAIWIVFSSIITNASGIISEKATRVPSEYQTARQIGPTIQKEVMSRIDSISEKVKSGEFTTEDEIKREADIIFEEGQKDIADIYMKYENAMKQRAKFAQNISRFSPAALFQYASENIVGSGIRQEDHFLHDVQVYSAVYDDYIMKKVGKLVTTSPWSFSTNVYLQGNYIYISSP